MRAENLGAPLDNVAGVWPGPQPQGRGFTHRLCHYHLDTCTIHLHLHPSCVRIHQHNIHMHNTHRQHPPLPPPHARHTHAGLIFTLIIHKVVFPGSPLWEKIPDFWVPRATSRSCRRLKTSQGQESPPHAYPGKNMRKVVPNQAAGHDRALQVAYNFVSTFLAVCLQFVEDLELET